MHENGCFTGCITLFAGFFFFFALWGTIESNLHERLLYQSQRSEVKTIVKVKDSVGSTAGIVVDGRPITITVNFRTYTLSDSTIFSRSGKTYQLADKVRRFYYEDHNNEIRYSDYYNANIQHYSYRTFWESVVFLLYVLVFTIATVAMYVLYYEDVKEEYLTRLSAIPKANFLDKVFNYLDLNKVVILISMIGIFLLIRSLGLYFYEIPRTNFSPSWLIMGFLISTFFLPIVFIQVLRNREKPVYRNFLNIIRVTLIVSTIVSLLLTLTELGGIGAEEETQIERILKETWGIFKELVGQ